MMGLNEAGLGLYDFIVLGGKRFSTVNPLDD